MRTLRSPQRRNRRPNNNLRQQQSITDSRREKVRSILTLQLLQDPTVQGLGFDSLRMTTRTAILALMCWIRRIG